MRTLNNIKDSIALAVYGGRKYQCCGKIIIHMRDGVRMDLLIIDQTIRNVDKLFPWHDDNQNQDADYKRYGTEEIEESGYQRVQCELKADLRKNQVYAYERYLATLAEELTKRFKKSEVMNVSYHLTTTSSEFFSVK